MCVYIDLFEGESGRRRVGSALRGCRDRCGAAGAGVNNNNQNNINNNNNNNNNDDNNNYHHRYYSRLAASGQLS